MKLNRLLLGLVLAGLATSWALAQDATATSDSKSKSDVRTITGCLTKGDSADEFLLTRMTGAHGRSATARADPISRVTWGTPLPQLAWSRMRRCTT